ncbi:hypothetical protein DFH06DRAFT_1334236 [Mycena polygramma]|nr:hypothetical protein DFH06DRAFT_1334236 [Mycena polygramma]
MDFTYYDILGLALADTIDEYVRLNVLTGTQGIMIMQQFDRAMTQALTAKVKAKTSVKAHLRTYNDYQAPSFLPFAHVGYNILLGSVDLLP